MGEPVVQSGEEAANSILGKLLRRAENALAKDASRAISLRLSDKSVPEYWRLQRHKDKLECNAVLRAAEKQGGIKIEWDKRADENSQVERVLLLDENLLASYLGVVPRWLLIEQASREFASNLDRYPLLEQVLENWRHGSQVRNSKPGDFEVWISAIRVIDYCRNKAGDDIPIRRLSASLFSNSKRLETLVPYIDSLIQNDLSASIREAEEVFSELGLVKFQPTLLLAGDLAVLYGQQETRVLRPYIGLAPKEIKAIKGEVSFSYLLTVENLTTFHELVSQRPQGAIVFYTGGMPSPSWKRVYKLLLQELPSSTPVYHWGDIDGGGFRIANHLAMCCSEMDFDLRLHCMTASLLPADTAIARDLLLTERTQIQNICERWSWGNEKDGLGTVAIEQEALPIVWPATQYSAHW